MGYWMRVCTHHALTPFAFFPHFRTVFDLSLNNYSVSFISLLNSIKCIRRIHHAFGNKPFFNWLSHNNFFMILFLSLGFLIGFGPNVNNRIHINRLSICVGHEFSQIKAIQEQKWGETTKNNKNKMIIKSNCRCYLCICRHLILTFLCHF